MTSHAMPFSQHHPNRNRREKRTKPELQLPPIKLITAYARTLRWDFPMPDIGHFIHFHQNWTPGVWTPSRIWKARLRQWHRDISAPQRLASAVALALSAD
jgi:hypothetical protein